MLFKRIKRKLYKAFHPVVGEVWMLHRVVEQRSECPEQRVLEVTPDWLEQQILKYKKRGYTFISIDAILNTQFPTIKSPRWVCMSFDDGYRDNYTLAYPLLKRLGVPFIVYVSTGFIGNRLPMWWYPGEQLGISVEELKDMDADPLCTIGVHTVSHPKLDTLTYDQQRQEIADSKQSLETLLGHEIKHFSFPHGAYNEDTLKICQDLEFCTIAAAWGGPVRKGAHFDSFPRIAMKQP